MLLIPPTDIFDPLLNLDQQQNQVSRFKFFNASEIMPKIDSDPLVLGSSPRWIMMGSLAPKTDPQDRLVTNIMVLDMERESELRIGRGFPYRNLGYGEAHVTESVLKILGIQANQGERILVDLGISKLLSTFNIDAEFLESVFLGSIMQEDVQVNLNGTLIAEALRGRGIDVPPELLPERIQTSFPIRDLVDVRRLISVTIDAIINDNLMDLELVVVDGMRYSYEKWPPIGNVVLLEAKHFLAAVKQAANKIALMQMLNIAALVNETDGDIEMAAVRTETPVADAMFDRNIFDYSFMVLVQYSKRIESYCKDSSGTLSDMVDFSNAVSEKIGFDSELQIQLLIQNALQPLKFLRIFLNQIFTSVVSVLIVHGCLTIYALLLNDAGARTYEYGMLRVLGMRKYSLGFLLMTQAFYYAIPGVILGMLVSYLVSLPILHQIAVFAKVPEDYTYKTMAMISAITIGILMPIAGNIVPVQRVLVRTLAESLDLYHQSSSDTSIHIQRLEDLGLSPTQTTVAIMMIFSGGLVYYVVPMSFLFQDFELLISSLNLILMGTVFGLITLSTLIQSPFEQSVVKCIMWGKDRKFLDVVLKNLASHRERSRKTSLMFTSSLAFIVFAGAMFSLQADSIVGNIKVALGSELRVESRVGGLNEDGLTYFFEREQARPVEDRIVKDYAWVSWPLWNVDPPVYTSQIANAVQYPRRYSAEIASISPNYLDVTFGEYFVAQATHNCFGSGCVRDINVPYDDALTSQRQDPVDPLSASDTQSCSPGVFWCRSNSVFADLAEMQFPALVSASLAPTVGAEVGTELISVFVVQRTRSDPGSRLYLYLQVLPRALLSKFPGFFFSSYGATAAVGNQNVLIGEATWQRLMDLFVGMTGLNATEIGIPTRPPKRIMHVKYKKGVTLDERLEIINGIRAYTGENTQITDTLAYVELTAGTLDLLMAFFYVISTIAALLCFFMLFTTFEANVRDNLWEFGVLRALGVSSKELVRIFIYEAMGMIIAAIILGASIGLTIACVLTLQQNLFTEMPFRLVFPGWLFALLIVLSLFVAGVGSYLPVRSMLKCSIAQVLKGT